MFVRVVRCIGSLGRGIGALAMARRVAPSRSRTTYALGLEPLYVFLLVAVVLGTKIKGQERSPARMVLMRKGTLPCAYKRWIYEDMDGAVHDLAGQYA
jgi:hypothetical protein